MAAGKKKAKVKRKKAPARRPAARGKAAKARKKPARKAPVRRVSPKAGKRAARPAPAAKPVVPPAQPAPPGERIGVVTHYFSHVSVAVVKLDPGMQLRVGDTIHIRGHTTDFSQRIESLQVEHAAVLEVGPKDDFGLKVREHAREHDVVYIVTKSGRQTPV